MFFMNLFMLKITESNATLGEDVGITSGCVLTGGGGGGGGGLFSF